MVKWGSELIFISNFFCSIFILLLNVKLCYSLIKFVNDFKKSVQCVSRVVVRNLAPQSLPYILHPYLRFVDMLFCVLYSRFIVVFYFFKACCNHTATSSCLFGRTRSCSECDTISNNNRYRTHCYWSWCIWLLFLLMFN